MKIIADINGQGLVTMFATDLISWTKHNNYEIEKASASYMISIFFAFSPSNTYYHNIL